MGQANLPVAWRLKGSTDDQFDMVTPRQLYEPDLTNRPRRVPFGTQKARNPTWIPPNAGTHETQKEWLHLSDSHDTRVQIRDLTVPKCATSTVNITARKIGEADLIRRSPSF